VTVNFHNLRTGNSTTQIYMLHPFLENNSAMKYPFSCTFDETCGLLAALQLVTRPLD